MFITIGILEDFLHQFSIVPECVVHQCQTHGGAHGKSRFLTILGQFDQSGMLTLVVVGNTLRIVAGFRQVVFKDGMQAAITVKAKLVACLFEN